MLAVIVLFVPSCHYLVTGSSRHIHKGERGEGGRVGLYQLPFNDLWYMKLRA